ncbi:MAG: hypothetical protein KAX23_06440, partial [Dehalococcoidia bacterium]|nr:hypothetical protein [Dehalococcoidia bacterium]
MKTRVMRIGIPVVMALFLILALASPAAATVTVTPAGGEGAISADDFGGAWTTLTAIVITEGSAGDIAVGDFVLTIPSGFEFNTGSAPDVVVTGAGLAANSPAAITATTITVTVTSASTAAGTLTIGGATPIQVRPTQGTPLASGNILMTSGTIAGVDGTTNFGTLTEVHGAATKFVIIDPT